MDCVNKKDLFDGLVLVKPLISSDNLIYFRQQHILTIKDIEVIRSKSFNYTDNFEVYSIDEIKDMLIYDTDFALKYVNFITQHFFEFFSPKFINSISLRSVSAKLKRYLFYNVEVLGYLTYIKYFDSYTFQHSLNVAIVSMEIGVAFNLSEEKLVTLAIGSFLHDIGKVDIPLSILNKPNKLDSTEMKVIKKHPQNGVNILKNNLDLNSDVLDIVLSHHEKLDRTGYPNSIGRDKICLLTKIVTVSDIFDALVSHRVYHKPISTYNAVLELKSLSMCNKLDKDIVDCLVSLVDLYPKDTYVVLSNNAKCLVVKNDISGVRPLVYDVENKKFYDLAKIKDLKIIN